MVINPTTARGDRSVIALPSGGAPADTTRTVHACFDRASPKSPSGSHPPPAASLASSRRSRSDDHSDRPTVCNVPAADLVASLSCSFSSSTARPGRRSPRPNERKLTAVAPRRCPLPRNDRAPPSQRASRPDLSGPACIVRLAHRSKAAIVVLASRSFK